MVGDDLALVLELDTNALLQRGNGRIGIEGALDGLVGEAFVFAGSAGLIANLP